MIVVPYCIVIEPFQPESFLHYDIFAFLPPIVLSIVCLLVTLGRWEEAFINTVFLQYMYVFPGLGCQCAINDKIQSLIWKSLPDCFEY